jgi:hypothetical protein
VLVFELLYPQASTFVPVKQVSTLFVKRELAQLRHIVVFYVYRAATATVEQLSTASVAGRVQRNEARFSRNDNYVSRMLTYVDVC